MILLILFSCVLSTAWSVCVPKLECLEHTCCFTKNDKEEKCCRGSSECTECGCVCLDLDKKCPAHSQPLASVANVQCGSSVAFKGDCAYTKGTCEPLCQCEEGYINSARPQCTVDGRYLVAVSGGEACTLAATASPSTAAPSASPGHTTMVPTNAATGPTTAAPTRSPTVAAGSPTKAPTVQKNPGFWVLWRIIAIACGGFVLLVLIVIIIYCCCCRNKKKKTRVAYDYSAVVNETW